jgi:hypothetical protein
MKELLTLVINDSKSITDVQIRFLCCGFFSFGLFEGMSAIEMMDPKMDAGMLCNQTKHKVLSLNQAVQVNSISASQF